MKPASLISTKKFIKKQSADALKMSLRNTSNVILGFLAELEHQRLMAHHSMYCISMDFEQRRAMKTDSNQSFFQISLFS